MSDLLTVKITKFDSLNDRERKILDELMSNPSVKIREVCERLGEPEQTVRGSLTRLYEKLGVPENERDKRGFLVREYQEAYQERYLRVGEISSETLKTPKIDVSPKEPQKVEIKKPTYKDLVILSIFFGAMSLLEFIFLMILIKQLYGQ